MPSSNLGTKQGPQDCTFTLTDLVELKVLKILVVSSTKPVRVDRISGLAPVTGRNSYPKDINLFGQVAPPTSYQPGESLQDGTEPDDCETRAAPMP